MDLGVILEMDKPLILSSDNNEVITNSKEHRNYKRAKHIERIPHYRGCVAKVWSEGDEDSIVRQSFISLYKDISRKHNCEACRMHGFEKHVPFVLKGQVGVCWVLCPYKTM